MTALVPRQMHAVEVELEESWKNSGLPADQEHAFKAGYAATRWSFEHDALKATTARLAEVEARLSQLEDEEAEEAREAAREAELDLADERSERSNPRAYIGVGGRLG